MHSIPQNTAKPNQINASSPINGGDSPAEGYRLAIVHLTTKRVDCNGVTSTHVTPTLCLIINGEIRRVSDWAALHGINAYTLRSRAERNFPLDKLFLPPRSRTATVDPIKQAKRAEKAEKAKADELRRNAERRKLSRLINQAFRPYVRGVQA